MSLYEKAFLMASQGDNGHIFEPIVGTVFDSEVDARQYYITYSWEMGFGIRTGKKYVNANGYKTSQVLHCSCKGIARPGLQSSVRKYCKAMVRLKGHLMMGGTLMLCLQSTTMTWPIQLVRRNTGSATTPSTLHLQSRPDSVPDTRLGRAGPKIVPSRALQTRFLSGAAR